MPVSHETLAELSLSEAEYEAIVERLDGREPTEVELGMFGILWSEHCGYKHSRLLLRQFPTKAPWVLIGPGEENAGAFSIGDGLAVVMKIESHNHPSALEPYEGAATGVGGIVRDIFSMGARPVALLNALFFGPPEHPRTAHLFNGVVGGIGGYGNCMGIPDVAGQVTFSPSYTGNPLVNAMCVGIVSEAGIIRAKTGGQGNVLLLVGSDTGRDGIHGATFASVELTAESEERRRAVQVGNPFMEKLLLEACLEVAEAGLLVGMQDLGAGGITSAAVECAYRAGAGVEIDVARMPRREEGMTAYELMLSESQERMLLVVSPDNVDPAMEIFRKWDLSCEEIGEVTSGNVARIRDGDLVVAEAPIAALSEPPMYAISGQEDPAITDRRERELGPLAQPPDFGAALLRLLASPTLGSKLPVFRRYDHQVGNNTVVPPGKGDAGVLRIQGSRHGLALTVDVNPRWCYLDPYRGGALAVAEAARNLSCVGARPLAVTDCLNFGNPERGPVAYQLQQAIAGMADACRAFGIPVISGNVSLYNESAGGAIYPTPVVGMAGLLEDVEAHCEAGFVTEGDHIYLVGADTPSLGLSALGASEYLEREHHTVAGGPGLDLDAELRLQPLVREAIERRLLQSAHDISDGGLAITVAESCIIGGIGARVVLPEVVERLDATLFGEAPARIIVSMRPESVGTFLALATEHGVLLYPLGHVGGDRLTIGAALDLPMDAVRDAWSGALG
ncbi:MAG: phosphoribosylformylglycinamidine synthase subunit PurL [Chloroflexi bacterium]|nr:phosphoribosylformylglycinamidine synthase subunit PurL [Chloroflexota bacterium]